MAVSEVAASAANLLKLAVFMGLNDSFKVFLVVYSGFSLSFHGFKWQFHSVLVLLVVYKWQFHSVLVLLVVYSGFSLSFTVVYSVSSYIVVYRGVENPLSL